MSLLKKNSSRSLFKQKNTPEFLAGQVKFREALLKSLSRAIKEVQLQFANQDPQSKEVGAIGDCVGSQHVCNAFEEVLKHGLKLSWFGKGPSTFWPIVQKISRKQAVEYVGSLQHAQSDSAKCRGWIRMAVNECSLESYINVICQDTSLLSYYEEYSFVRDAESVSALTQLLTGLSLINFKLTVDVRSLEFDSVPEVHSDVPLRMNPALIAKVTKKSRRSKEKETNTEADNCSTASSSCVSLDSIPTGPDSTLPGPNSTLPGPDSILPGPDSASEGVSLDAHCNGGGESQQDSSDVATKGSDDGVWTDSDLLGTDGGFKYEEEGLEGVWHGGDEGEGEGMNISSDSDIGSGQEVGGTEEWDVDSTLTGHMIDHMTQGAPEEEEVEEVRGQSDEELPDTSYQRLLEEQVEGGAKGAWHHREEQVEGEGEGVWHHREEQDNASICDLQDRLGASHSLQDAIDIGHDLQDIDHDLQDTGDRGHDLQDTMDMGLDLQDRQKLLECHDTLVAEDQKAELVVTNLNPFASPSPPLSPTNPFLAATPPDSAGPNPFLLDRPEASNPFEESSTLDSHRQPLNPFCSDSAHNSPPSLSTNPFDFDDHAHTEVESRPPPPSHPSPPSISPPLILPTPPTPSEEQDFPGQDNDSHVPMLPDVFLPPVPHHAPQTKPNLPSSSPEPLPKSDRPGSASTTRSRTTDELESYSGSSIDVSVLLETTPSGMNSPSHLTSPEENFFASEMSSVEMQIAVDRLKVELAKSALDEGPDKDEMRRKVVALQMKLRHLKDEEEEMDQLTTSVGKEISGHRFYQQSRHTRVGRRRVCEGCGKKIRGVVHSWYLCKLCGFGYHKKCLPLVDRVCSGSKTASKDEETPNFILEVCPEKGLTHQHFRCASCNTAFNSTTIIARLCDYSGQYYCPSCHHNDMAVIPARVVHNWDFTPRKVCCKCCDLLDRQATKPLLKVRSINPLLYTYVQDLVTIETLRKDLLVMKTYFVHCPNAMESHLLNRLNPFPHFKDGAKRFSLLDLKAVHSGALLKQLTLIHEEFSAHIKRNCTICSGKGFSCELCHSTETLYPFDRRCRQCPKCRTIFHRNCYAEMSTCPKCSRTRHHKSQT